MRRLLYLALTAVYVAAALYALLRPPYYTPSAGFFDMNWASVFSPPEDGYVYWYLLALEFGWPLLGCASVLIGLRRSANKEQAMAAVTGVALQLVTFVSALHYGTLYYAPRVLLPAADAIALSSLLVVAYARSAPGIGPSRSGCVGGAVNDGAIAGSSCAADVRGGWPSAKALLPCFGLMVVACTFPPERPDCFGGESTGYRFVASSVPNGCSGTNRAAWFTEFLAVALMGAGVIVARRRRSARSIGWWRAGLVAQLGFLAFASSEWLWWRQELTFTIECLIGTGAIIAVAVAAPAIEKPCEIGKK